MQGHRRLARPGTALHHQHLVDRRPDHQVLLGLDRRHDLADRPGALGADLRQHGIRDPAGHVGRVRIVQVLVEIGGQLAGVEREAAPQVDAQRVRPRGAVERRGDRRPPVDDDRIVALVLDVPPADVPLLADRTLARVDAAEELAGARRAEVVERFLDGDLDVLRSELIGRAVWVDALQPLDHPVSGRGGERQPLAFGGQLGKRLERRHGVDDARRDGSASTSEFARRGGRRRGRGRGPHARRPRRGATRRAR